MRKILTFSLLALFAAAFAAAPALALDMASKSFYAHGVISLPTGDFGDFAGTGFGGGIGIMVPYNEQLNFRGEAGYIMFAGKEFGIDPYKLDYSYSMIPILALAEYHFSVDSPAYGLGGAGFYMLRFSMEGEFLGLPYDESESDTELGFCFGGGFQVTPEICIEGRYNIISDADQITVHGTYSF